MTEELKGLIEKIREEGVKIAEDKAREIELEAKKQAGAIVEKAKREATRLVSEAKEAIARNEESSRAALKQAGRDLLLSLRKEINATLDRIVTSHVHKVLTAEELATIISALIKEGRKDDKSGVIVSLKKEDIEKLERGFLSELRDEIKKGVTLKPSDDIQGGFIISYDSGKSYYDFTDKAIAKYITSYLRPKLAEIFNETT